MPHTRPVTFVEQGKIVIPKFLEATWYISWCILVHSTFHSLHQNGKQAYYITKQFLEGVPMRYTKQGFLRKNKDTSSKHYKVSIIFYFLFLIMGGSLVHIQILVLLFLKLETFFFLLGWNLKLKSCFGKNNKLKIH